MVVIFTAGLDKDKSDMVFSPVITIIHPKK